LEKQEIDKEKFPNLFKWKKTNGSSKINKFLIILTFEIFNNLFIFEEPLVFSI